MLQEEKLALPMPVLIASIKAGFELATRHWWLLLLPFALDCFLWLGPRLSIAPIAAPALETTQQLLAASETTVQLPDELWLELTKQFENSNLLGFLSSPFLWGVPVALDTILAPSQVPIRPIIVPIENDNDFIANFFVLLGLGIFLSTFYYSLMAEVVRDDAVDWVRFGRNLIPNTFRMIGILLTILFINLMFAIPIIILAAIAGAISPAFSAVVLIGSSVIFLWTIIFLSFSAHALLVNQTSIHQAMLTSVRIIQRQMPFALPVILTVFILRTIVKNIVNLAIDGTWLTLVSMAGHAFIATALIAATFIFFRDRVAFVLPQN